MYEFHKVTNNENYDFLVIPVKPNSDYEDDPKKCFTFKGRPANTGEKKMYRLQKGVDTHDDSVYIFATNLPEKIKPGDKVKYLGQIQIVESVGYYYDLNYIVNPSVFSEEYIVAQMPKGITLS